MNNYYGQDKWVDMLGTQRQDVRNLVRAGELDPELRDTAATFLRAKVIRAGGDPDNPASFRLISELPPGDYRIGRVINGRFDGPVFAVPAGTRDNIQHIGIFGPTRRGKTYIETHLACQIMEKGGLCWMLDLEDQFSTVIPAVSNRVTPVVMDPPHLRINFFQSPDERINLKIWLDELCLFLRGAVFLRDGSLNLFAEHMLKLYQRSGSAAGSGQYPTLAEVLEHFRSLKFSLAKSRSNTWLESLINRLTMIFIAFEETAHVASSDMLPRLARRSVIFRLHGLRGIPLQFLVNFLMIWLTRYKECN